MQFMNIKKFTIVKIFSLLTLVGLTSACTTLTTAYTTYNKNPKYNNDEITDIQKRIVERALQATQMSYSTMLNFDGKSFTNDCSGLLYGIFWEVGIDLIQLTSNEKGNGVKRLHTLLDKNNLLHNKKLPNVGDLVFWNNTYGRWGKNPLSHAGVIVSVDSETGQIEYVHNNTYLGAVRKESMNLYKPHENRPTNNYMRYDNKYKKTSAELFDSFGMAWQL